MAKMSPGQKILCLLGGFGLVLIFLCCGGLLVVAIPQHIYAFTLGPIVLVWREASKMQLEWESFAVAGAALLGFVLLLHGFLTWLWSQRLRSCSPTTAAADPSSGASAIPRRWRKRWTLSVAGVILACCMASIGILVFIHQAGWLLMAKEPIYVSSGREAMRRITALSNLKQIGVAIYNQTEQEGAFPTGGDFSATGEGILSWEAAILPYLEGSECPPPHPERSWRDPLNGDYYRRVVPMFVAPSEESITHDGYGLSHFAANVRVLAPGRRMNEEDVSDGWSNTIVVGAVNRGFRAWGDPVNHRDPATGLHDTETDFYGTNQRGSTNFLFMDGSVRSLSNDIDPAILRALATPNGDEEVEEPW